VSARPEDFLSRFADDCVWTVGGSSSIAGVYRGRAEIAAFFRRVGELSGGTYTVDPQWELGDGEHGIFYYRARGSRPDRRTIDLDQAIVGRLDADGRYSDVRVLPFDQGVFDAFWA
jgi:ketosteroid isomerase-like protein